MRVARRNYYPNSSCAQIFVGLIFVGVVSLFTKVPVDEAMHAISEMLEKDEAIDLRTTMSPSEVCRLTSLCLRSTYFRLKNSSVMEQPWVPPFTSGCQPLYGGF